jgi:uncharacterized protein (DUF1684 family)
VTETLFDFNKSISKPAAFAAFVTAPIIPKLDNVAPVTASTDKLWFSII